MFQMSNDICLLPDNSVEGLAFFRFFVWFTRRVGKKWKERNMWLWERSCCTTLLQIAVFFFFWERMELVDSDGTVVTLRNDWLFKPGLVEFYPSSPCCYLNLDSFDWKFGNWGWSLFFFYVLVVFLIFGWGLCKMIDLREKNNSRIKGQCQTRG